MLYSTEDFYRSSITSAVLARRFRDGAPICAIKTDIEESRLKAVSRERERICRESKIKRFRFCIIFFLFYIHTRA